MSRVASLPAMLARVGVLVRIVVCRTDWRVAVGQDQSGLALDAGGVRDAVGQDPVRDAEHADGETDQVHTEVEQRTAGEVEPLKAVLGREPFTEVGYDSGEFAEGAYVEELRQHVVLGQECGPVRLHAEQAVSPGNGGDLAGLASVERERLLHHGGFAGGQGEHRMIEVFGMRGGDVDDVDVGIGDELLVAAMCSGDPGLLREDSGAVVAAGADSDDLLAGVGLQRGDEPLGDPAGPHHAPPQNRSGPGVRGPGGGHGGRKGSHRDRDRPVTDSWTGRCRCGGRSAEADRPYRGTCPARRSRTGSGAASLQRAEPQAGRGHPAAARP